MPKYTVDNPSENLAKAKAAAEKLFGADNIASIEVVTGEIGRVELETKSAVEITELSLALAKLEKEPAAAEKPTPKTAESDDKPVAHKPEHTEHKHKA